MSPPKTIWERQERAPIAFVADHSWFLGLNSWLEEEHFEVGYEAKLSDDRRVTDLVVGELLALPNDRSAHIRQVDVMAYKAGVGLFLSLGPTLDTGVASVAWRVYGDEKEASHTLKQIKRRVADLK